MLNIQQYSKQLASCILMKYHAEILIPFNNDQGFEKLISFKCNYWPANDVIGPFRIGFRKSTITSMI